MCEGQRCPNVREYSWLYQERLSVRRELGTLADDRETHQQVLVNADIVPPALWAFVASLVGTHGPCRHSVALFSRASSAALLTSFRRLRPVQLSSFSLFFSHSVSHLPIPLKVPLLAITYVPDERETMSVVKKKLFSSSIIGTNVNPLSIQTCYAWSIRSFILFVRLLEFRRSFVWIAESLKTGTLSLWDPSWIHQNPAKKFILSPWFGLHLFNAVKDSMNNWRKSKDSWYLTPSDLLQ